MSKAFAAAIALLSRRDQAVAELRAKLKKKGFAQWEIEQAIDDCQRLGYQSEERFVGSLVRTRAHQGYGPLRIRQELQSLQIEDSLIESALEAEPWISHIQAVWQKKYQGEWASEFEGRQKQKRFLLYRGFPVEMIERLTKEFLT